MNSSMAWPYDSCELTAGSEFKTAPFECSSPRSRRTVLGRFCFGFREFGFAWPILAASSAAHSVWERKNEDQQDGLLGKGQCAFLLPPFGFRAVKSEPL